MATLYILSQGFRYNVSSLDILQPRDEDDEMRVECCRGFQGRTTSAHRHPPEGRNWTKSASSSFAISFCFSGYAFFYAADFLTFVPVQTALVRPFITPHLPPPLGGVMTLLALVLAGLHLELVLECITTPIDSVLLALFQSSLLRLQKRLLRRFTSHTEGQP